MIYIALEFNLSDYGIIEQVKHSLNQIEITMTRESYTPALWIPTSRIIEISDKDNNFKASVQVETMNITTRTFTGSFINTPTTDLIPSDLISKLIFPDDTNSIVWPII